jgi:hypothetical protein
VDEVIWRRNKNAAAFAAVFFSLSFRKDRRDFRKDTPLFGKDRLSFRKDYLVAFIRNSGYNVPKEALRNGGALI